MTKVKDALAEQRTRFSLAWDKQIHVATTLHNDTVTQSENEHATTRREIIEELQVHLLIYSTDKRLRLKSETANEDFKRRANRHPSRKHVQKRWARCNSRC